MRFKKSLKDGSIKLRLLCEADFDELVKLASNPKIWTAHKENHFKQKIFKKKWFDPALEKLKNNKRYPYVILLDNRIIGSSSFYDINETHKRLNIGYTWISPKFWGLGINAKVKHLMFQYVFEVLHFHRITFCIDQDNINSCKAIEKVGAIKEGVLRNHIIRKDNSVQNSVLYSVIDTDWPTLKLNNQAIT